MPDYQAMKVGDRARMPVLNKWEGANQTLYREINDYCATAEPRPAFEVETVRTTSKTEFWLCRTR